MFVPAHAVGDGGSGFWFGVLSGQQHPDEVSAALVKPAGEVHPLGDQLRRVGLVQQRRGEPGDAGLLVDQVVERQQSRTRVRDVATCDRLAGIGGLTFAATLLAQNLIRASGPGFGAAPAQVTAYFLHHRAAALVPLGLFPAEMVALFAFVAAVWATADRPDSRWQASLGTLGAATIAALFAIVNITEIVLSAKASSLAASPAVVQALWAVHAAAFGLDLAAIAVALLGLSYAAAPMSLIPAWFKAAAWPAAACLLTASVFTVALANGGPWIAIALPGFAAWLVFVITASARLLHATRHHTP